VGKSDRNLFKTLWTVFKFVLALSLLGVVVILNWTGLSQIWVEHVLTGKIYWGNLALAAVICLVSTVLTFVRWYILVRAVKLPFTLSDALRLGVIGYYYNILLPGSVGGDILKAAFLAREHDRRTVAVATVIMDRLIGLWGLFWFVALLGGVFWMLGMVPDEARWGCGIIVVTSAITVGMSVVVWALLGLLPEANAERFADRLERLPNPKIGAAAGELWRVVWMYRCQSLSVYLTLLMSVVGFVGFVLTFYFAVLTLEEPAAIPSLAVHFLIVPIGLLLAAVPLFPNGLGISEAGFGGLYVLVGFEASNAVSGSLVQRVVTWGLALIGLLVYQRMRPALKQAAEKPIAEQGLAFPAAPKENAYPLNSAGLPAGQGAAS
jgi:glycosyltransferase 2 family protein